MRRLESIVSPDDPRVLQFRLRERELRPRRVPQRVLKGRSDHELEQHPGGLFVAEGDLVVERALAAGLRPHAALTDASNPAAVIESMPADVPVYAADHEARRMLTGLGVALNVIALFERPAPLDPHDLVRGSRQIVLLEEVDNPTNVGTVARSTVALGADALLLDRVSSDPLSRRALRVSMGVSLSAPHARVSDPVAQIDRLTEEGFVVFGLTPSIAADDIENHRVAGERKTAMVLGSERRGLSDEILGKVHHRVRIPMRDGVDSLNVAAASAIAAHVLFRRD